MGRGKIMEEDKITERYLPDPNLTERPYINIPGPDLERYIFEEDLKKYNIEQDVSEKYEINQRDIQQLREESEEYKGISGSILDDRFSEFRDRIEQRIKGEIENLRKELTPKKEKLPEERIKMPFKY